MPSALTPPPPVQVVRVCVSVCCHPLDLRSLAVCPALTSLHLDKCKGTVLCGLHGNKKIREIVAQVCMRHVLQQCTYCWYPSSPSPPPPPLPPPSPHPQDNDMTGLDLSELVNLSFLDLKGNRLPALAGLHHCGALLELAVDGNRLTRLSECPPGGV